MNQEIKAEWLKRLKSGEYIQGEAYLCDEGKHCCLGVLATIAEEQGICKLQPVKTTEPYTLTSVDCPHNLIASLNQNVLEWSGLRLQEKLMQVNDNNCDGKYTAVIPLIEAL